MKTINSAFNIGYARAVAKHNATVRPDKNAVFYFGVNAKSNTPKSGVYVRAPGKKIQQCLCINQSEIARAAYSKAIQDYNNNSPDRK
jgi:hypothetical protein